MSPNRIDKASAAEQGLAHFARQRSGLAGEGGRREVQAWIADSEANASAYEDVSQVWQRLESVRADPAILSLRDEARRAVERRRTLKSAGAAAAVMLLGGLGLLFAPQMLRPSAPVAENTVTFETAVGQLSTVALPDGSIAVLDTGTTLKVNDGPERRLVQLVRGRALFKVRHDASRPFIVTAQGRSVTALGTEFEVYIKPSAVDVGLIEGKVQVQAAPTGARSRNPSKVTLTAGHRATSANGGWTVEPMPANPSWLGRQLVFQEAPLSEVVAEMNRYSPRKIVLADREVGLKRMSAVLRSDEPATFLESVEALGLGRVSSSTQNDVISRP